MHFPQRNFSRERDVTNAYFGNSWLARGQSRVTTQCQRGSSKVLQAVSARGNHTIPEKTTCQVAPRKNVRLASDTNRACWKSSSTKGAMCSTSICVPDSASGEARPDAQMEASELALE